jgi:hypothetical protein
MGAIGCEFSAVTSGHSERLQKKIEIVIRKKLEKILFWPEAYRG